MSLRTRLIMTFTLVVFISLFITAVVVSVLLQGTRDRNAVGKLESQALPITVQFRQLVSRQATLAEVYSNLQEQAQQNNVYILLLDANNNIVRQISPETGILFLNIPAGQLPSGITQQANGTFQTAGKTRFMFVAFPVSRAADATTAPRLVELVLATPRSGALATFAGLIAPFLWAAVISLVVSIFIAIFLARSIYNPVKRLAAAAEAVAQGKYDRTIPVEGSTELKELAAGFNGMSAQVKESQQQLRHFVADVSHQLKSPLTSIQGFAQAMLDGTAGDDATREKAAKIIVDESQRMIRQVNELLDLSRMQSGQVKMAKEPVDLEEIITHCQEIFAPRVLEKNLKMTGKLAGIPKVTGDADRLEDVFCNLLDNAIKNTPAHGEVSIEGRAAGNSVEIILTDTGPGIPPEQIPFLFKRFQHGADLHSGTGLGLAIAMEIVLAHGGNIEVSSSPGEGARFKVMLPAMHEDANSTGKWKS